MHILYKERGSRRVDGEGKNDKGGEKNMVTKKNGKKERERKITKRDRKTFRKNALEGTKKWEKTPTGARKAERVRQSHGWGFGGKSPDTEPRRYKTKEKKKSKASEKTKRKK